MLKAGSRAICLIATLALGASPPLRVAADDKREGPAPTRVYAARYPRLAHLAGTEGEVRLIAVISPRGAVREVRADSGPGLLIDAARDMLSKWLFSPCPSGTEPCEAPVTFRFVLDPGLCDASDCPNDVQFDAPATITIRSRHRQAIVN